MKNFVITITLLFFFHGKNLGYTKVSTSDPKKDISKLMLNQSIKFIENKGQLVDMNGQPIPHVLFKAESTFLNLFITNTGLTYVFYEEDENEEHEMQQIGFEETSKKIRKHDKDKNYRWSRIDMVLENVQIANQQIVREGESSSYSNFFLPHCPAGIEDVKEYEKIIIKDIYPGIDWVLYNSSSKGFKYDFIIHDGGNPEAIKMQYLSKKKLQLKSNGDIQINTKQGKITENKPISFLNNLEIQSDFKFLEEETYLDGWKTKIGFDFLNTNLESLDEDDTLIIDPQLIWSTFYGTGSAIGFMSMVTDQAGNLFVAGYNNMGNFPSINPGGTSYFQGIYGGGNADAIILKFNNLGARIWATYYGGSVWDFSHKITIDSGGNIIVVGETSSTDLPTLNTGTYYQGTLAGATDAFILKFSNNGTRLWASYYGGASNTDIAYSVVCDNSNNIFITGFTSSTNFPTLNSGTYFVGSGTGVQVPFILKFDSNGNRLWATYFGSGSGIAYGITCDSNGNIFVTGGYGSNLPLLNAGTYYQSVVASWDVFIVKFNNLGTRLWTTALGGSGLEYGYSIICDPNNNIFIAGKTSSANFPTYNSGSSFLDNTLNGTYDAFIVKFDNSGNRLWCTYYGGSLNEYNYNISYTNLAVMKPCGTVYFSFETNSTDMNTQASCEGGYYDATYNGGLYDQFITSFSNSGSLLWASYYAGANDDFRAPITVDLNNNLYIGGEWTKASTNSTSYPLFNAGGTSYYDGTNSGGDDCFISKLGRITTPITTTTSGSGAGTCVCSATTIPSGSCSNIYNYSWNTNPIQTTATATNLCTGSYNVTISDAFCNTITSPISINCGTSLPIELISFNGINKNQKNLLYWDTDLEINNDFFQIDRSIDGINWELLGTLKAKGNSSEINHYSIADDRPYMKTYYRLKQIDFNMNYRYYAPIFLENKITFDNDSIYVYPNPTSDIITVNWRASKEEKMTISINNLDGKSIITYDILPKKGDNSFIINLLNFASGIYYLELKEEKTLQRQIIKQ